MEINMKGSGSRIKRRRKEPILKNLQGTHIRVTEKITREMAGGNKRGRPMMESLMFLRVFGKMIYQTKWVR